MARASAAASKEPVSPGILPLPKTVVEHHGGQTLFRSMSQWLAQKRVPPVLLLTGPSGVGKRAVAYFISQWLLCERTGFTPQRAEESGPDLFGGSLFGGEEAPAPALQAAATDSPQPCGECIHCQRAVKGNWVDFTEISADTGDGETGSLKIEQFRKLKDSVGFGAFDGAFKITLIRDADRMTVQAANSVLKLLEEPPTGWIFILTASDSSLLLPTIVSRCQALRLKPFPTPALLQLLTEADVSGDRRSICAELAQGSWNKALSLAQSDAWDKRVSIFKFLEQPQSELNALVEWASSEPSHFDLMLNQFEHITSELIQWSLSPSTPPAQVAWKNQDGKKSLVTHAQTAVKRLGSPEAARAFWMERSERFFKARQEASAPLNRKLLIQDLLIPWVRI